jgi:hypothetical protein
MIYLIYGAIPIWRAPARPAEPVITAASAWGVQPRVVLFDPDTTRPGIPLS